MVVRRSLAEKSSATSLSWRCLASSSATAALMGKEGSTMSEKEEVVEAVVGVVREARLALEQVLLPRQALPLALLWVSQDAQET